MPPKQPPPSQSRPRKQQILLQKSSTRSKQCEPAHIKHGLEHRSPCREQTAGPSISTAERNSLTNQNPPSLPRVDRSKTTNNKLEQERGSSARGQKRGRRDGKLWRGPHVPGRDPLLPRPGQKGLQAHHPAEPDLPQPLPGADFAYLRGGGARVPRTQRHDEQCLHRWGERSKVDVFTA